MSTENFLRQQLNTGMNNLQIGNLGIADLNKHNHPQELPNYSNTVIVDGECLQCLLNDIPDEHVRKRVEVMVSKLSAVLRSR